MTWAQIEKRIMARFDAIEARQADIASGLREQADEIKVLAGEIDALDTTIRGVTASIEELAGAETLPLLEELAEDARRRERLQWLAESRAAMGRAS